jgi:cytochrome c-type biogenesis protein CcmE
MKPKQQRLVLAGLALASVVGAGFLALSGLEQKANYFYSPADLAKEAVAPGQAIRLGGMVTPGSLVRQPDGKTVTFRVHDGGQSVDVRFTGITPDLFKEGSGVVADGAFEGTTFVATNILAKHDERYMPPQLNGNKHKTTTLAAK